MKDLEITCEEHVSPAKKLTPSFSKSPSQTDYDKNTSEGSIIVSPCRAARDVSKAKDYLALVKKTVRSTIKDPRMPLMGEGNVVGPKAIKWLDRAEASLTKDPELVKWNKEHYEYKESQSKNVKEAQGRKEKKDFWTAFSGSEKDEEMANYLMDAGSRYRQKVDQYAAEFSHLKEKESTAEELKAAQKYYYDALDREKLWNETCNAYKAFMFVKTELKMFRKAWKLEVKDGERGRFLEEMREHALNAIAWNIRARLLAEKRQART